MHNCSKVSLYLSKNRTKKRSDCSVIDKGGSNIDSNYCSEAFASRQVVKRSEGGGKARKWTGACDGRGGGDEEDKARRINAVG